MDENEQTYVNFLQEKLQQEETRRIQSENNATNISAFNNPKEQGLIEFQLDLKEELDRLYHLLSGHIVVIDKDRGEIWVETNDDKQKILSEYGVNQIMNIVSFYINRNTLLSNYDKDTIQWKVRDFAIELIDLVYCRYEEFFYFTPAERLYEIYMPFIQKYKIDINEDELYDFCRKQARAELQSKITHFPMIIINVTNAIHSTYLRALNGEERESLRKFMHVSQNQPYNQNLQNTPQFALTKPSTWLRRR